MVPVGVMVPYVGGRNDVPVSVEGIVPLCQWEEWCPLLVFSSHLLYFVVSMSHFAFHSGISARTKQEEDYSV